MGQPLRVLVLGAGFGGLEVTSRLAARCGDAVDITLIDAAEGFIFGFSKLDVMFGRVAEPHVVHAYRDLVERPGVRFVQARIETIDPAAKQVETSAGTFDADVLVVALGAELDASATPGLREGGHEYYTVAGAFAVRDVLANFDGGRVVIAVTSTPFKCPPAPSETALLMHDFLQSRGLREKSSIALVMPLPKPIPPSPAASEALLAAFAERDIEFVPNSVVRGLDATRRVALLADDSDIPYDLFLGVPKHCAPDVVVAAGMTVDG
jgi:sulfide:quinone oxidoreductase